MLPVPSGSYAIGRQSLQLTDPSRADQFSPGPLHHRELMVYIWYPAQRVEVNPLRPYLPGAKGLDKDAAAHQAMRQEFEGLWPSIVSGTIQSHAISGAPVAIQQGQFPVVLFSHGLMSTTFSYTAQIEDLVSHGYVVVAIDHPDAASAILFTDGHIRAFRHFPTSPSKDPLQAMVTAAAEEVQIGAADVRFVVETLAQGRILLAKAMDLTRMAAAGHSYGGTLTARACQLDPRIKVCISEDGAVNPVGAFIDYRDHTALIQPFLLLEIGRPDPSEDELLRMRESRGQWRNYQAHKREQLASCKAGSYHVLLSGPGISHGSFSDEPILNDSSGPAEQSAALKNLLLIERIERAFLDKYLKKYPATLLDSPELTPSGVTIEHIGK